MGREDYVVEGERELVEISAAPFFLYASRPALSARPLAGLAFAAFPFLFSVGLAMSLFALDHLFWAVALVALALCAWAGCVFRQVLRPVPAHGGLPSLGELAVACGGGAVAAAVLLALGLFLALLTAAGGAGGLLGLVVVSVLSFFVFLSVFLCPLMLLLSPAPAERWTPGVKAGPWRTAIAMVVAVTPLAVIALRPLDILISGRLAAWHYDRSSSWAHEWSFMFVVSAVMMFLFLSLARWLCDRRSRWGYWVFVASATVICLLLAGIITTVFVDLVGYVQHMGWTPRRLAGLAFGVGGYVITFGFWIWAIWPPRRTRADT